PETVTNVITDIEEDGGGSGIELGYDDTPVDTVIEDTVDTVTAYLTAATTVNEGQRQLVYTVTLRDADGNAVVTNNDVTVTTAKGVVVIPAGSSSGSFTVPVQGDDPYIDPETITNAITAISEANAGSPGAFENLSYNDATVSTHVKDTIDPVNVLITADSTTVVEGGELTYTVELRDADNQLVRVPAGTSVTVYLDWTGA